MVLDSNVRSEKMRFRGCFVGIGAAGAEGFTRIEGSVQCRVWCLWA